MAPKNRDATASQDKPPLIIDARHCEQLLTLASQAMKKTPELASQLLEEIARAEVRPSEEMPENVVTIGAEVTFRDLDNGQEHVMRLVFPGHADIKERRLSVLTPMGAALLGLSTGHSISWEMDDGRIKNVTVVGVNQAERPAAPLPH